MEYMITKQQNSIPCIEEKFCTYSTGIKKPLFTP